MACGADAEQALVTFEASLKTSLIESAEILECRHLSGLDLAVREAEAPEVSYRLRGRLVLSASHVAEQIARKSLFILATNEHDKEVLSPAALLSGYKGQIRVERGFRFLKDPQF